MLRGLGGAASSRPRPRMPAPFILLFLSICAVWAPKPRRGFFLVVPPWALLYAAATALALVQGIVQAPGLAALLVLLALAAWASRARHGVGAVVAWGALLALCTALALHRVPGFLNPVVIDGVRFGDATRPFTQHLNFDKGSVGLVLLALLAPRLRAGDRLGAFACTTVAAGALTTAAVLGLAVLAGVVRPDLKLPPQAAVFLLGNLLLTCVAEQALFRSLVQEPWRGTGAPWRVRSAIVGSAMLFGLAHGAGGAWMVLLGGLAGLGHALVYERTRRIESAILVQFGVNATHFFAFTYPALAPR